MSFYDSTVNKNTLVLFFGGTISLKNKYRLNIRGELDH